MQLQPQDLLCRSISKSSQNLHTRTSKRSFIHKRTSLRRVATRSPQDLRTRICTRPCKDTTKISPASSSAPRKDLHKVMEKLLTACHKDLHKSCSQGLVKDPEQDLHAPRREAHKIVIKEPAAAEAELTRS